MRGALGKRVSEEEFMTINPTVKRNSSSDVTVRASRRNWIHKAQPHMTLVLDLRGNAVWGD
jgi:hypothetical protein